MQEAVKRQIDALAFSVAIDKSTKDWHGTPKSRVDFDMLCEMVASELTRVVEGIESGKASTGTTKRPARKPAEPKAPIPRPRGGIEPEALRNFLSQPIGGVSNPATLQEIADNFTVSKGVAQRAVNALPGVKSGPGTKGKRGKAPTVYWVE